MLAETVRLIAIEVAIAKKKCIKDKWHELRTLMNSNEVFQKVFYKAYNNGKTTNFLQKSENIENKLNSFVGSNNQKSLPRKTKILNKSVTNFEVKMQMAKGCEK